MSCGRRSRRDETSNDETRDGKTQDDKTCDGETQDDETQDVEMQDVGETGKGGTPKKKKTPPPPKGYKYNRFGEQTKKLGLGVRREPRPGGEQYILLNKPSVVADISSL